MSNFGSHLNNGYNFQSKKELAATLDFNKDNIVDKDDVAIFNDIVAKAKAKNPNIKLNLQGKQYNIFSGINNKINLTGDNDFVFHAGANVVGDNENDCIWSATVPVSANYFPGFEKSSVSSNLPNIKRNTAQNSYKVKPGDTIKTIVANDLRAQGKNYKIGSPEFKNAVEEFKQKNKAMLGKIKDHPDWLLAGDKVTLSAAGQPSDKAVYKIKPGDTINKVVMADLKSQGKNYNPDSSEFQAAVEDFKQANQELLGKVEGHPDWLLIGDEVELSKVDSIPIDSKNLPGANSTADVTLDGETLYTVKGGDTINGIVARRLKALGINKDDANYKAEFDTALEEFKLDNASKIKPGKDGQADYFLAGAKVKLRGDIDIAKMEKEKKPTLTSVCKTSWFSEHNDINLMESEKDKVVEWHKRNAAEEPGNYIIVDKKTSKLTVYNTAGEVQYEAEVGLGKDKGDEFVKNKKNIKDKRETTSAGSFTLYKKNYAYFKEYDKISDYGRNIYELDTDRGESGIALSQVPNGQSKSANLKDGDVDNNRFTNGNINLSKAEFKKLESHLSDALGTKIYVLPEDDNNFFVVKNGKLNFTQKVYDGQVFTTKGVDTQSDIDIKLKGELADNENAIKFAKELVDRKEELMNDLNIDDDTYNSLAQLSIGIAQHETQFGEGKASFAKKHDWAVDYAKYMGVEGRPKNALGWLEVGGKLASPLINPIHAIKAVVKGGLCKKSDSVGLTQMKVADYTDPKVLELFDKYGISEESLTMEAPEKSAVATMIALANMKNSELPALTSHIEKINEKNANDPNGPYPPMTIEDSLIYLWNGKKKTEIVQENATPHLGNYHIDVKNSIKDGVEFSKVPYSADKFIAENRDAERSDELAVVARKTAKRLNIGGQCSMGGRLTLEELGYVPKGKYKNNLAYQWIDVLANHKDFEEVKGVNQKDYAKLPAGTVIVWDRSIDRKKASGHMSVCLGNGYEASDKIFKQITSNGAIYGEPHVFIMKKQPEPVVLPDPFLAQQDDVNTNNASL